MATLREILYKAGFRGDALNTAYAIAMAESGGRPTAHNGDSSTGDNSYGLFQINMLGAMGPDRRERYNLSSNEDLFDPLTNARIAFKMSNGGENWSPWTTYTTGIYREYLDGGDTEVAGRSGPDAGDAGARKKGGGGKEYGDYGYVQAFQEKHPEIADLIDKARKQGWTPERLSYEIKDTDWWAKHTEAQRRWALIIAESPEQADQLRQDQRDALQALAIQSGVKLGPKELDELANKAAKNEWDEADMRLVLSKRFEMGRNKPLTGTANDAAEIIDQMAWEYGVPVDRATKKKWITQTIAGQLDPASMEDRLREQAKILYGGEVAKQLNTQTLRDIMSPYLQAAASELGIPPEQMMTTDGKWTKPLTGGAAGLMTLDEWTKTLRSDKRYGWDKTSTAKATAASLAADLGKLMGSAF